MRTYGGTNWRPDGLQVANLRYCTLKICAANEAPRRRPSRGPFSYEQFNQADIGRLETNRQKSIFNLKTHPPS
jgi:hypothetical protein